MTRGQVSILVVDNDPSCLGAVTRLLGDAGFHVEAEGDPAAAARRLNRGGIDILITDHRMGPPTGLELVRTARAADPSLVALIHTGAAELKTVVGALREGVFDFLRKPVAPDQLIQAVDRAVRQRTARAFFGSGLERISAVGIDLLHVEDDPAVAALVEALLEETAGGKAVRIRSARSIAEAETLVGEHAPDLILTDLGLPDCNGLETFVRVQTLAPNRPGRGAQRKRGPARRRTGGRLRRAGLHPEAGAHGGLVACKGGLRAGAAGSAGPSECHRRRAARFLRFRQ
ncbi:MAG: response regulator [Proteobacteria bacterium]|nr:response regulator [Pseudomonadota bacterium]